MVKFINKIILTLLSLLFLSNVVFAENLIQLRIHDEKIYEDESFLLIVTALDKYEKDDLETRPLLENFVIGSVGYSFDEAANKTIWRIPMITHSNGKKIIPRMLIKNNVSDPLEINVRKSRPVSDKPELKNLISYQINNEKIFVNQTLIYKITINKAPNVEISSISTPSVDNGRVHFLNEDTIEKKHAGQIYTTTTITYAITFTEPGKHVINQPIVNGTYQYKNIVINNDNLNTTIKLSDPSKQKNINKNKIRFVQQNQPIEFNIINLNNLKNVVVADSFKISESWEPENTNISIKTPIIHEIHLEAVGTAVANLPQFIPQESPLFKSYLDKSSIKEEFNPETNEIKSKLIVRQVFVPLKNINLNFASDKINWIHNKENSVVLDVFELKPMRYEVISNGVEGYNLKNSNITHTLLYILIATIIILLIGCIIYLLVLENIISIVPITKFIKKYKAKKYLINHFDTKDPKNAYKQIINFAQVCFSPKITCFEMLPNYNDFKTQLDDISKHAWSNQKDIEKYDGNKFVKIIKKFTKQKKSIKKKINKINPTGVL